jgi:hypothetical protein
MFGFKSRRQKRLDEITDTIGAALHGQIKKANDVMKESGELDQYLERINGPFTGGYLYSFLTNYFSNYITSRKDVLQRSKDILNEILSGEDAELVKVRLNERLQAEDMSWDHAKDISWEHDKEIHEMEFDLGVVSAEEDARDFISNSRNMPTKLTDFLLNGKLASDSEKTE